MRPYHGAPLLHDTVNMAQLQRTVEDLCYQFESFMHKKNNAPAYTDKVADCTASSSGRLNPAFHEPSVSNRSRKDHQNRPILDTSTTAHHSVSKDKFRRSWSRSGRSMPNSAVHGEPSSRHGNYRSLPLGQHSGTLAGFSEESDDVSDTSPRSESSDCSDFRPDIERGDVSNRQINSTGLVTTLKGNFGFIENEYYFCLDCVMNGVVQMGDFVKFCAVYNEDLFVRWRCVWVRIVSQQLSEEEETEPPGAKLGRRSDCRPDDRAMHFHVDLSEEQEALVWRTVQKQAWLLGVSISDVDAYVSTETKSNPCSWHDYRARSVPGREGSDPIEIIIPPGYRTHDTVLKSDIFRRDLVRKFLDAVRNTGYRLSALSDASYLKQFLEHGFLKRDKPKPPAGGRLGWKRFAAIQRSRAILPIASHREEILDCVKRNQVVVICGGTGSGKSTQIPNYILEEYIPSRSTRAPHIIVTQPRRLSAEKLAERVAVERNESLGESVGFCIRCDHRFPTSSNGTIAFCTPGTVLRWILLDTTLSGFTHIVIDEIHERDVFSDILLILLKVLLNSGIRKDIRVILMSATVNSERLSQYFRDEVCRNVPIISIGPQTFHISEYYLEDVFEMLGPDFLDHVRSRPEVNKPELKVLTYEPKEDEYFEEFQYQLEHELPATGLYKSSTLNALKYYNENLLDLKLVVELIKNIMRTDTNNGAILVFVTGFDTIMLLLAELECDDYFVQRRRKCCILPLHASLSSQDQDRVFETMEPDVRKIVVATNIAETSLTIQDVVHVIDCGKMKVLSFDCQENLHCLGTEWISQASAIQRAGRAGRVQNGVCYHLYSKLRNKKLFRPYIRSETERLRLENFCLQIISLQLGPCVEFFMHALDPPPLRSVQLALDELYVIGAIDEDEKLTPLGSMLVAIPADVHCAKAAIYGTIFNCRDPLLVTVAALDFRDPMDMKFGKINACSKAKAQLSDGTESDHWAFSRGIQDYDQRLSRASATSARKYCRDNCLSPAKLEIITKIRDQFIRIITDEIRLSAGTSRSHESMANDNQNSFDIFGSLLYGGMYPKVAFIPPLTSVESKRARGSGKKRRNEPVAFLRPRKTSSAYKVCRPKRSPKRQQYSTAFFHERSVKRANVPALRDENSRIRTANNSQFITFHEALGFPGLRRSCILHDSTPIPPLGVILFGGHLKLIREEDNYFLTVDDWATFSCRKSVGKLLIQTRNLLDQALLAQFSKHSRLVSNPSPCDKHDGDTTAPILDLVVELLRGPRLRH